MVLPSYCLSFLLRYCGTLSNDILDQLGKAEDLMGSSLRFGAVRLMHAADKDAKALAS